VAISNDRMDMWKNISGRYELQWSHHNNFSFVSSMVMNTSFVVTAAPRIIEVRQLAYSKIVWTNAHRLFYSLNLFKIPFSNAKIAAYETNPSQIAFVNENCYMATLHGGTFAFHDLRKNQELWQIESPYMYSYSVRQMEWDWKTGSAAISSPGGEVFILHFNKTPQVNPKKLNRNPENLECIRCEMIASWEIMEKEFENGINTIENEKKKNLKVKKKKKETNWEIKQSQRTKTFKKQAYHKKSYR